MDTYAFAPARPALRYYGGGWTRAPWTISHFPAHELYDEPCAGAASVFARKPPAVVETLNDRDGRAVNFFRVLRNQPSDLLAEINATPWAQDELQACLPTSDNPLEDARRFFVVCWQSYHGGPTGGGGSFRWQTAVESRYAPPPHDMIGRDDLLVFAERLRHAQITNMDALALIRKHLDQPERLTYFDPPYLAETRAHKRGYNHEVTPAWHRLAAALLRQHQGYVVVAGYRSRLYERCYENYGWQRVEREQQTNGGSKRTECLWLNPRTQAALAAEAAARRLLSLFDYMEEDGA